MDSILTSVNQNIVNPLIVLLFAIALVVFLWGVLQLGFNAAGDGETLNAAKRHVLYGLLGMFIMISAFGLIRIITGTFNIPEQNIDRFEK